MITSVSIGGYPLTGTQWFLQAIKNASFPATVYTRSKRGGKNGNKLISPTFASYQMILDFKICGTTFADLSVQRDLFLGNLGHVHSLGIQTMIFTRSDGLQRQIDIKAIEVTGDYGTDDSTSCIIEVTFGAEYPFMMSSQLKSQDVLLSQGGGMPIPMPIPMSIAANPGASYVLTNAGNYPAYPLLTFAGGLVTPTLTNVTTGKSMTLAYTLTSSTDLMVVDCYLGTVVIKPSGNVGRQYWSGTFFTINPGINTITLTTPGGTDLGKCTVQFRDTYLNV